MDRKLKPKETSKPKRDESKSEWPTQLSAHLSGKSKIRLKELTQEQLLSRIFNVPNYAVFPLKAGTELDEIDAILRFIPGYPIDDIIRKYGSITDIPLGKDKLDSILRAVGSTKCQRIKSFLRLKCGVQDPTSLSREEIAELCESYLANENLKLSQTRAGTQPVEAEQTNIDIEKPIKIEAALTNLHLVISHSSVKQAAKKGEIRSIRSGTKKNSPYLVYPSEVETKFGPHGTK